MIGEHHHLSLPFTAASALNPEVPVRLDTAANRQVVLAASANLRVFGLTGQATALQGEAITIHGRDSVVEAVAGASLGAGALIGVGSNNGALAPVAGASGSVVHVIGESLESAAAGEKFALYINPRQLSGTP